MHDLAVTGATVVAPGGERPCDVYVTDGRVSGLLARGRTLPAREVVDATGLHLLPGVIDAHTHFRTYSKHCDVFADMARSAAHGGVTTVLAFIMGMNATEHTMAQRISQFMDEGAEGSMVDYGFHAGLADEPGALEDIAFALESGIASFKMFMAYRQRGLMVGDDFMLRAMRRIGAAGGLAMVHAEAGDVIDVLTEEAGTAGGAADAFARSRPAWTEAEAARRAARLAEAAECPLYVVHVSSEQALEVLLEARGRGQRVFIETCPQYLELTHEVVRARGALAKIAPPLRHEHDVRALRGAVLSGDVDVVASDHAPYTVAGKGGAFQAAPVGAPGTETLLAATLHAVRAAGGALADVVRVLSERPARVLGLPRKGRIEVGADADLCLVDCSATSTVDGGGQHNRSGYSLFDGLEVPMAVRGTFLRGQRVLDGAELAGKDLGRYLHRSANPARPATPGSGGR